MSIYGSWTEPFRAAFQSIWAHKLRSLLTTLGIIIGVASVIVVVHLTKSLENRIMADVNKEGSHTFFLYPFSPASAIKKGQKVRWQPIDPDLVAELRELVPEVQLASSEYYIFGQDNLLKHGEQKRRILMHAMDENGMELANMELACGRAFTTTDRITKAPVIILGSKLAEELDLGPENLGGSLTIAGQTAEIIGILKKQGDIPFVPKTENEDAIWGTDNEVFVPVGSFKELTRSYHLDQMSWRLQVDTRVSVKEAQELLESNLRRVRGIRGDDVDNFRVETNQKQVAMVEKLGRTLLASSGAMVGISLLVGGIGVMNIMLVSVQERTREIGIRKAMGARRKAILVQFLIEAMLLCIVGGVLGLIFGMGIGSITSQILMKQMATIPTWAFIAAVGVPALVGVAFGLYPANRAAKMDPIEALRYE